MRAASATWMLPVKDGYCLSLSGFLSRCLLLGIAQYRACVGGCGRKGGLVSDWMMKQTRGMHDLFLFFCTNFRTNICTQEHFHHFRTIKQKLVS